MSVKPPNDLTTSDATVALPTQPLGLAERALVETALADVAPDWSVDLQGICMDEAMLILLPPGGDDGIGPSFVISRESFGFKVDIVQWDLMQDVGSYAARDDAVAAIRARLACGLRVSLSSRMH